MAQRDRLAEEVAKGLQGLALSIFADSGDWLDAQAFLRGAEAKFQGQLFRLPEFTAEIARATELPVPEQLDWKAFSEQVWRKAIRPPQELRERVRYILQAQERLLAEIPIVTQVASAIPGTIPAEEMDRLTKAQLAELAFVAGEWRGAAPDTLGPFNSVDMVRTVIKPPRVPVSELRVRLEEVIEGPARRVVQRILEFGGTPISSNAYGNVPKGVRWVWSDLKLFTPLTAADYEGWEEEPLWSEPSTGRDVDTELGSASTEDTTVRLARLRQQAQEYLSIPPAGLAGNWTGGVGIVGEYIAPSDPRVVAYFYARGKLHPMARRVQAEGGVPNAIRYSHEGLTVYDMMQGVSIALIDPKPSELITMAARQLCVNCVEIGFVGRAGDRRVVGATHYYGPTQEGFRYADWLDYIETMKRERSIQIDGMVVGFEDTPEQRAAAEGLEAQLTERGIRVELLPRPQRYPGTMMVSDQGLARFVFQWSAESDAWIVAEGQETIRLWEEWFPPEPSARTPSSPRFFDRVEEWSRWLRQHTDSEDEIVVLPYHAITGGRWPAVLFLARIIGLGDDYLPADTAAMIATLQEGDKTTYVLLLNEVGSVRHPEPPEDSRLVYHRSPIDLALGIVSEGLYTFPGRTVFRATLATNQIIQPSEDVVLAFRLPPRALSESRFNSDFLGLPFSTKDVGARLPDGVRQRLKGYQPTTQFLSTVVTWAQLEADEAGLLVRVGPETIDVEETLARNADLVRAGKVDAANYERLRDALIQRQWAPLAGGAERLSNLLTFTEEDDARYKNPDHPVLYLVTLQQLTQDPLLSLTLQAMADREYFAAQNKGGFVSLVILDEGAEDNKQAGERAAQVFRDVNRAHRSATRLSTALCSAIVAGTLAESEKLATTLGAIYGIGPPKGVTVVTDSFAGTSPEQVARDFGAVWYPGVQPEQLHDEMILVPVMAARPPPAVSSWPDETPKRDLTFDEAMEARVAELRGAMEQMGQGQVDEWPPVAAVQKFREALGALAEFGGMADLVPQTIHGFVERFGASAEWSLGQWAEATGVILDELNREVLVPRGWLLDTEGPPWGLLGTRVKAFRIESVEGKHLLMASIDDASHQFFGPTEVGMQVRISAGGSHVILIDEVKQEAADRELHALVVTRLEAMEAKASGARQLAERLQAMGAEEYATLRRQFMWVEARQRVVDGIRMAQRLAEEPEGLTAGELVNDVFGSTRRLRVGEMVIRSLSALRETAWPARVGSPDDDYLLRAVAIEAHTSLQQMLSAASPTQRQVALANVVLPSSGVAQSKEHAMGNLVVLTALQMAMGPDPAPESQVTIGQMLTMEPQEFLRRIQQFTGLHPSHAPPAERSLGVGEPSRPAAETTGRFPAPLSALDHRWNQAHFAPEEGTESYWVYLDRHGGQMDEFRDRILPLLVEHHRGDRRLRIADVGSATGEGMASLLAAILQAFEAHPEWGSVDEEWDIVVEGIERDPQVVEEAQRRFTGESPFVVGWDNLFSTSGPPTMGSGRRVRDILAILNRHADWVARSVSMRIGDATQSEVLETLRDYDAICMNVTFGHEQTTGAQQVASELEQATGDAFLLGTSEEHNPVPLIRTHHLAQRPPDSFHLQPYPYTIAVPGWARAAWDAQTEAPPAGAATAAGQVGAPSRSRETLLNSAGQSFEEVLAAFRTVRDPAVYPDAIIDETLSQLYGSPVSDDEVTSGVDFAQMSLEELGGTFRTYLSRTPPVLSDVLHLLKKEPTDNVALLRAFLDALSRELSLGKLELLRHYVFGLQGGIQQLTRVLEKVDQPGQDDRAMREVLQQTVRAQAFIRELLIHRWREQSDEAGDSYEVLVALTARAALELASTPPDQRAAVRERSQERYGVTIEEPPDSDPLVPDLPIAAPVPVGPAMRERLRVFRATAGES